MTPPHFITSAAVYFTSDGNHSISVDWFSRARAMFLEYELSPILFTADGGVFLPDDAYVLAEKGADIQKWGESLEARQSELIDALQNQQITGLGLDSPSESGASRSDWRGSADIALLDNTFYLGLEEQLAPDASQLLKRAYNMSRDILTVRYGIAYKSPLADYPDGYASGFVKTTTAEVFEWLWRDRSKHTSKTADELWTEELVGQRRHLTGLFRGAYPANILSELHVQKANLLSHQVGTLSQLNDSQWLWELSDAELPTAQSILESEGVLVSQAAQ